MNGQRQGYALARAELIHALTAYTGITTADGVVGKNTLIDANLIGSTDFITSKTIIIQSGSANNQDKAAVGFNPLTGEITVDSAFSHQIMAGTIFRVLNISTVELDVVNILTRIGTNTDPAGTTTLFAWFAKVWASLFGFQGLYYQGTVTDVPDATHFRISALIGYGSTFFRYWEAYVLWDAAGLGAAPQDEHQQVSAFNSADATFTHPAFTASLAVGDKVLLLHPWLITLADWLNGGRLDLLLDAIKTQTDKIAGKMLFSMDFWSDMQEEVVVTGAQTTPTLPSIVLAGLPAGATIVRAILIFKFRAVENTFAGANKLDAAAPLPMQVNDSGATGWVTAIDFVDDAFGFTAVGREGGDVIIGDNNIAARVDGNDTYPVRWLNAKADQNNLQFNDCQVGLRIWYSV